VSGPGLFDAIDWLGPLEEAAELEAVEVLADLDGDGDLFPTCGETLELAASSSRSSWATTADGRGYPSATATTTWTERTPCELAPGHRARHAAAGRRWARSSSDTCAPWDCKS